MFVSWDMPVDLPSRTAHAQGSEIVIPNGRCHKIGERVRLLNDQCRLPGLDDGIRPNLQNQSGTPPEGAFMQSEIPHGAFKCEMEGAIASDRGIGDTRTRRFSL